MTVAVSGTLALPVAHPTSTCLIVSWGRNFGDVFPSHHLERGEGASFIQWNQIYWAPIFAYSLIQLSLVEHLSETDSVLGSEVKR